MSLAARYTVSQAGCGSTGCTERGGENPNHPLARTLALRNSDSGTGGPLHSTPRTMVRIADRHRMEAMISAASGNGRALHRE